MGSLIEPFEVYDGDFYFNDEIKKISLCKDNDKNSLPLVTISSFGRYDSHINKSYIEDMEGFEIANICHALNQPFRFIKIVSNCIIDNPKKDTAEFYENYVKVMNLNTENIFNKINTYMSDK